MATIVRVPAATAARASASESSSVRGPSSMPGRMWQWRSITGTLRVVFGACSLRSWSGRTARTRLASPSHRAAELSLSIGARLEIVSAYEPVPSGRLRGERQRGARRTCEWMVNPREDVDATLREAAEAAEAAGLERVGTHARQGDPADAILDVAEEQHADLIVVGNKGMTGAKRFLLGSVPEQGQPPRARAAS